MCNSVASVISPSIACNAIWLFRRVEIVVKFNFESSPFDTERKVVKRFGFGR